MSGVTTIIVGQPIRPGCEDDFVGWQKGVTAEASRHAGYLSSELTPPTEQQPDWTAVYRFDSVANARQWLDSSAHQNLLDRAAPLFAGPGTRQIIADGDQAGEQLVTAVATRHVPDDKVEEFLAWYSSAADSLRKFPGFRGVELFRPIKGVQDDWAICLKFDTAEHLDAWLTSGERKRLLQSGPFNDFTLRRIDHSFGNWFSLTDQAVAPPSNFKTSIAVWMGLYPSVMFLTLLTMPLNMPLWSGLLIGNLLSSFVMSYLVMPYYANPILGWWLRPKADAPQPRTNLLGIAVVLAINAAWAVFFIVLTTRTLHIR